MSAIKRMINGVTCMVDRSVHNIVPGWTMKEIFHALDY